MLQEFSVTATEALITYLAFLDDVDYDITVYQVATEPHVNYNGTRSYHHYFSK